MFSMLNVIYYNTFNLETKKSSFSCKYLPIQIVNLKMTVSTRKKGLTFFCAHILFEQNVLNDEFKSSSQ